MIISWPRHCDSALSKRHGLGTLKTPGPGQRAPIWVRPVKLLGCPPMRLAKPTFPAPDHDHGRCTADALHHAERVCAKRAQKFTPIRRHVLETLLSSHRPLGAYEVIEVLAKSMPRPA